MALPVPPTAGSSGQLDHLGQVYQFVNDAPSADELSNTVVQVDTGPAGVSAAIDNATKVLAHDVTKFGAKGDGTADDTAAIQAALDARNTIYFPPGTYRVTSTLYFQGHTTIIGAGAAFTTSHPGTTIVLDDAANVSLFESSNLASATEWVHHFRMQDLTIRRGGNGVDESATPLIDPIGTAGHGIVFYRMGENCLLRNVLVRNFPEAGIKVIGNSSPATLRDVSIYYNQYGIECRNPNGPHNFHGVTAYENHVLVRVVNDTAIPTDSGFAFNLQLPGVKCETTRSRHNPPVLCENLNNGSIVVVGGEYMNNDSTPTAGMAVVKVTGTTGTVTVVSPRQRNYAYWVDDTVTGDQLAIINNADHPRPGVITHQAYSNVLPRTRLRTTRYYASRGAAASTRTTLDGYMWAAPIYIGEPVTVDRLGIEVTTAAATSVIRLGIYRDSNGIPGNLLLDAGTVASDTTGVKELTVSQRLRPGLYWLTATAQGGGPVVRSTTGSVDPVYADSAAGISANAMSGYFQSGVTAALPATASATPAQTSQTPRTFVRVAL